MLDEILFNNKIPTTVCNVQLILQLFCRAECILWLTETYITNGNTVINK